MKQILVAGAGHGGLVAAGKLAKAGFDVTVVEKCSREELGHDWEDRFTFSLLEDITGIPESKIPKKYWRFRGDCAFVSPAKRKKIIINYTDDNRQKVMWRKYLMDVLLNFAEKSGVKFIFECEITAPYIEEGRVSGIETARGLMKADMVIDAAGVFSPVRAGLPEEFGIERTPKHGDLFYAYRAYFNYNKKLYSDEVPFEVYMYHEGEQGLSWFCTNDNDVDVLIGRIDEFSDDKVNEQIEIFRNDHPWLGTEILHGGCYGVIPVRRPLTLMVADGYAAVGDSAFMTTPMNGMGIDLSLQAGELLAETISADKTGKFSKETLWGYNRDFHRIFGGDTAKNEGLKNAILSLPATGVDFLFENEVIQSSDLAGAGRNTKLSSLLGKFIRGMRGPSYFFTLVGGLVNGAKASKLYKNVPENYSPEAVSKWSEKIKKLDIIL